MLVWFDPFRSGGQHVSVGALCFIITIEEMARCILWRLQKSYAISRLSRAARDLVARLDATDATRLSITHGMGQAIIHAFVVSMSWIPYIFGDGTLYNTNYTCMSLFTLGALSMVPMSAILISLTVIIFRLYDHGKQINGCLVGILYFLASGMTLFNTMAPTWGCVVSLPLLYGLIHHSVLGLFSPTS